ncbi:MAG: biotin attachment protein [Acidobacteria bacterium]|nr:biotin attachment protein [Acidobacteriota bacterium]MBI3656497.1 biotin attachment protein [Acidobacteriota bacterium]
MKVIAKVAGQTVPIEVTRVGGAYAVAFGDKRYAVDARALHSDTYLLLIDHRVHEAVVLREKERRTIHLGGEVFTVEMVDPREHDRRESATKPESGRRAITAQMPGKVVRVLVHVGDVVDRNQSLLVLEAMKMQNEIKAPRAGRICQLAVAAEMAVNAGDLLLVVE